jgi:hypothetical protein
VRDWDKLLNSGTVYLTGGDARMVEIAASYPAGRPVGLREHAHSTLLKRVCEQGPQLACPERADGLACCDATRVQAAMSWQDMSLTGTSSRMNSSPFRTGLADSAVLVPRKISYALLAVGMLGDPGGRASCRCKPQKDPVIPKRDIGSFACWEARSPRQARGGRKGVWALSASSSRVLTLVPTGP